MRKFNVVVQESTSETRAIMIAKLVDIAEESQKINDFHTCVCIVLGLMCPAVSRLKNTWLVVDEATLERFQALCSLSSPEHNSSTLRSLQQQAPLPVVPFIQLLKKDLLTAEEIPTKFASLINVNKVG
jgi:RasGEF domain